MGSVTTVLPSAPSCKQPPPPTHTQTHSKNAYAQTGNLIQAQLKKAIPALQGPESFRWTINQVASLCTCM